MEKRIITISREFGSGGRTIGKLVAEHLGIRCYDAELIQKLAAESGFDENYVKEAGEYTPGGFLASAFTNRSFGPTNEDLLWKLQYRIIRELAEKESCVIIGRCANYILKDYPNVIRVFIHASWDFRMEKAAEKLSMSTREIEKFLQKDDRRKDEYYRRFTGQEWKDATQYDLCLDSSKLGYDKCIEEIENQLNMLKNK